ncbi:MAG TPA: nucleoside triphosphate pyrophosphatase [Polyangiaceae bacterium]|nr:nucleoside triphosphate pyrophosphatase [Polyangiaceae bacterium]
MSSRILSKSSVLVLGSASPRRRDILTGLGIPIVVMPADVDETRASAERPDAYLQRIVRDKLNAVMRAARAQSSSTFAGILVADTTVIIDEDVLGKPNDVADAERLLRQICGRTHVVKTRYAIATAMAESVCERTVETRVSLRRASDAEISRYAATGEGLDKAGAYAAQGIGAFLVERIEGSYTNVVGLPACEVVSDLQALGLLREFPALDP